MAFKVVTIADRISQYPDRRRLTKEDGSSELVTVAAEEGTVSAEGTEWGAAYANDLETRIDAETHLLEGNFGTVEATTTASKTYAVGQCLTLNGQLYKVIAAISKGATLAVGTNIAVHSVSAINSNLGGTTFSVDANGAYVHYIPTGGADPVTKKLGSIAGIQTTAFSTNPPTDAIAIMIYVRIKDQNDTFYGINTPVFCNKGEQISQEIASVNTHTSYKVTVTWNATTNTASFTVNISTLSTADFVAVWLSPST